MQIEVLHIILSFFKQHCSLKIHFTFDIQKEDIFREEVNKTGSEAICLFSDQGRRANSISPYSNE